MSIRSIAYQQSVYKRCYSNQHFSEFYLQDGGENQLVQLWNEITSLSPYVYANIVDLAVLYIGHYK